MQVSVARERGRSFGVACGASADCQKATLQQRRLRDRREIPIPHHKRARVPLMRVQNARLLVTLFDYSELSFTHSCSILGLKLPYSGDDPDS